MRHDKLPREVGNWVNGDKFWDRESELERFLEHLDEGAHVLLTAPRRTGKTSLLRETERVLLERGRDYALYVDLERAHSPEDAIVEISLKTRPFTGLWRRAREVFFGAAANLDELKIDDLSIKLRDKVVDNWRGKGDRLLATLAELDDPVVIFLDEFPILINRLLKDADGNVSAAGRQRADAFLSWLRAASLHYQGKLRFVLSGSIGLGPVLQQAGLSATVNNFRTFELEPWEPAIARECLDALARYYDVIFAVGATERMTDLLGLSIPHHVQMFFSHVYEDSKKRWGRDAVARNEVTVADVDRVYNTRLLSARGHAELSHFEERLRSVLGAARMPLAIDLLNEATAGGLTDAAARILTEDHLSEREDRTTILREVLAILEHDGYLVVEGGAYTFASRLIRDWWHARFSFTYTPTRARARTDGGSAA